MARNILTVTEERGWSNMLHSLVPTHSPVKPNKLPPWEVACFPSLVFTMTELASW